MTDQTDAVLDAARAAQNSGQHVEALRLANTIIAQEPNNVQARLIVGLVHAHSSQPALAAKIFQEVLKLDPNNFDAAFWLSGLARRARNLQLAVSLGRRAAKLRPDEGHAYMNLGFCLMESKELQEAAKAFESASMYLQDKAIAYHFKGMCLGALGKANESIAALRAATEVAPDNVESLLALGERLRSVGESEEAVSCAQKVLALKGQSVPARHLLVESLFDSERIEEGESQLQEWLRTQPNDAKALSLYGLRLVSRGLITEAITAFKRSIEADPKQGFAYYSLLQAKVVDSSDRFILSRMRALLEERGIPAKGVAYLRYGLGKAHEDMGEYPQAMVEFDAANAISYSLNFGERQFDREQYSANVDGMIASFPKDKISDLCKAGSESDVPIFIVGMMRSGTTLIEQIVSSAEQVRASGENRFWKTHAQEWFEGGGELSGPKLRANSAKYLDSLIDPSSPAKRVTDKMPGNYALLGLIHSAFPNARIIHARRNPADTCLSIYALGASFKVPFANDKSNIVFAYEEYLRLMTHWRKVLPPDRFMEIDYERLVSEQETVSRSMIEFCGLEWSDACLRPEENRRTVLTPSVWQVRKPVYTSAVRRWMKYKECLGAFDRLLELSHQEEAVGAG